MRLPPAPGSERRRSVAVARARASPHLAEGLGEFLRAEEPGHPRVIEDLSLGGHEGHGGEPVDPEALVQRVDRVLGVGAIDLDADEARGLLHHRRGDVGLAVQLLAGGAPLREEVDHDRLVLRAGTGQRRVHRTRLRALAGVAQVPHQARALHADVQRREPQQDGAGHQRHAGPLEHRVAWTPAEAPVNGPEENSGGGEPSSQPHPATGSPGTSRRGRGGAKRGKCVADVGGGERDQKDAERALHPVHPRAALRQPDGEDADEEERHPDAQRVDEEQPRPERGASGGRHVGQQTGQHRPGARRGEEAGDAPHQKRARDARAAHRVQPQRETLGKRQLERAEHARGEDQEEHRQPDRHRRMSQEQPRTLHRSAPRPRRARRTPRPCRRT